MHSHRLSIGFFTVFLASPLFFTVFLASPLIGFYSKIFKDLKWLTLVAFIFFAAFFGMHPSPRVYHPSTDFSS